MSCMRVFELYLMSYVCQTYLRLICSLLCKMFWHWVCRSGTGNIGASVRQCLRLSAVPVRSMLRGWSTALAVVHVFGLHWCFECNM